MISPEILILSDHRPVSNFSKSDLQVWLVTIDKQVYWGLVHSALEIFENAASFLGLGLLCTIICHENRHSSNEHTVQTWGIWKRGLCDLMWTENIFKMEFFQNDDVTISSNTYSMSRFEISPTKCGWKTIDVFSSPPPLGAINILFSFLRHSVDRAWVFAVPGCHLKLMLTCCLNAST